jgi:hypothetical protein
MAKDGYNAWQTKNEIVGELIAKEKYSLLGDGKVIAAVVSDTIDFLIGKDKANCSCVTKKTEVHGMAIIYPRVNCPYHGHLVEDIDEQKG